MHQDALLSHLLADGSTHDVDLKHVIAVAVVRHEAVFIAVWHDLHALSCAWWLLVLLDGLFQARCHLRKARATTHQIYACHNARGENCDSARSMWIVFVGVLCSHDVPQLLVLLLVLRDAVESGGGFEDFLDLGVQVLVRQLENIEGAESVGVVRMVLLHVLDHAYNGLL